MSATLAGSLLALLVGLCLGSFATAASARLPARRSLLHDRSRCPSCDRALGPLDLVPLASWLASRGRCRHCGAGVPLRYPLIEAATALLVLLAYLRFGAGLETLLLAGLATALVILAVTDLEWRLIPNVVNAAVALLGLGWIAVRHGAAPDAWIEGGLGLLLLGGLALLLRWLFGRLLRREALGLGDVKLMAAAGLWLGPFGVAPFLLLSGLGGIALALVWRLATGRRSFPFGPCLAAGLYAWLLLPELQALLLPPGRG